MFEDSFLDSFMESHIGGWTNDTERMYDEDAEQYDDYHCDNYPPQNDDDEDDWVEPMDLGDLLNHNQRHLDEEN
jgi:hypothetical protein